MFDADLNARLTDFCQSLTEDGYCPHGVAVIIPETAEDSALAQSLMGDPAKLRALAERADDPWHGQLHADNTLLRERLAALTAERDGLMGDLHTTALHLRDAEHDRDRLVIDLTHLDEVVAAEHATAVRVIDELAAERNAREDAEHNYEEACQSVGILAGELHRMSGIIGTMQRQAERARQDSL